MTAGFATYTPCIAKFPGNHFYRGYDIALGMGFGIEVFDLPKGANGKDGAGPCAKIFSGKVLSSYFPKIIVYISRINCPGLAFLVDILKKLLSRQNLAMINNFGEAAIIKVKTKRLATLAPKFKLHFFSCHFNVFAPHCGQSERPIVPRVLCVSDPDEGCFKQLYNRREHFIAREPGAC
jgi:hypothetical protein